MKKNWKHINFEQRKTIYSSISHNFKLIQIAELLDLDSTSFSKEVKRNRIPIKTIYNSKPCKKLNRWPYVCDNCKFKYGVCHHNKFNVNFYSKFTFLCFSLYFHILLSLFLS